MTSTTFLSLIGRVSSGQGDASKWLSRFSEAYHLKTGLDLFPGTLNLRIDEALSLRDPRLTDQLIIFRREEYGGEREILMLPCVLTSLDGRKALIWRTTPAEEDANERHVLEILAEVNLRQAHGLVDGDFVEVRVDLSQPDQR